MYLCTKIVLLRRSVSCLHGLGYLSASRNVISDNLEAGVMSKEFFSGMFSDDDSKAGDGFHPCRTGHLKFIRVQIKQCRGPTGILARA